MVVNVSALNEAFDSGATVNPQTLLEKGLAKGAFDKIKILGNGDLTKKLSVEAHRFSKSAEEKDHEARRLREAAWRARLSAGWPSRAAKGIVLSCFEKIILVFRIPELRRKILLTLILLAVYRLGYHVYLPLTTSSHLLEQRKDAENQPGGLDTFMQTISLFSASQLNSIFGLEISPYITASIIFQLLGTVYPPLEALQKEGEAGQRKINEYTRYATVLVCVIQSYVWIRAGMGGMGHISGPNMTRGSINSAPR